MRQVDDSAHGKCPSKKAVESVQVDFREKVQLAVDTPLEVFGEQFQCTVLSIVVDTGSLISRPNLFCCLKGSVSITLVIKALLSRLILDSI